MLCDLREAQPAFEGTVGCECWLATSAQLSIESMRTCVLGGKLTHIPGCGGKTGALLALRSKSRAAVLGFCTSKVRDLAV